MMHYVHVFIALEGHRKDQAFHILLRVSALRKYAILLLGWQAVGQAILVEYGEGSGDILQACLPCVIHVVQEGKHEHGLVRVAHGHGIDHLEENLLHVGLGDQCPSVFLRILLHGGFLEKLEGAMLADRHLHVGDDLPVPDISLYRFALDVYHLREGDLRKHSLRRNFFLKRLLNPSIVSYPAMWIG